jgi:hypothetical protein
MELTRARIVSAAMMFGVALFTGLACFLVSRGSMSSVLPKGANILIGGLFIVGLVVLSSAPQFARKVVAAAAKPGPNAFFVEVVVRNAIREAVGITGVALGLLSVNMQWILGFGIACVLAMATGWPRESEFREAERRLTR